MATKGDGHTFELVQRGKSPFRRWMGVYSPARGTMFGYRFHHQKLGVWVTNEHGQEFWHFHQCPEIEALQDIVLSHWGGGRVLMLCGGPVIKPENNDDEVGIRRVIAAFQGDAVLVKPDGSRFSFRIAHTLKPGASWPGPTTTGLECAIKSDGRLECSWYHPSDFGKETHRVILTGPSKTLFRGFVAARPGEFGGRVRVQMSGAVITNVQSHGPGGLEWKSLYIGSIDPDEFKAGVREAGF